MAAEFCPTCLSVETVPSAALRPFAATLVEAKWAAFTLREAFFALFVLLYVDP